MTIFSERLRELIIERDISPKQLAEAINVAVSSIHRWQSGKLQIHLSKLIKIANYFHCSLDFLTGRIEEYVPYSSKECPPFPKRLREVIKEKGISTYKLSNETKIEGCYFYKWDRGADPHIQTLIKLADYLDISIDYLVGREN